MFIGLCLSLEVVYLVQGKTNLVLPPDQLVTLNFCTIILIFRVTARTILVFSGIFTFLVDAYPTYAASALAANSFTRSSFGGIFPLFGIQSKFVYTAFMLQQDLESPCPCFVPMLCIKHISFISCGSMHCISKKPICGSCSKLDSYDLAYTQLKRNNHG
jgi:hypothetical protein